MTLGSKLRATGGRARRLSAVAREHARKTLRIARWEVARSAGTIDRRTALLGVAGALLVALVAPVALGGGAALDEGIYRVAVDDSNPYAPVVENSSAFRAVDADPEALNESDVELVIDGGVVSYDGERPKSEAALSEFKAAVETHNYEMMRAEGNQTAAFPVIVDLRYEERPPVGASQGSDADGSGSGSTPDGSGGDGADGSDGGSGDGGDGTGGSNGGDDAGGSDGGDDAGGSDGGAGDGNGSNGGDDAGGSDGGAGDGNGATGGANNGDAVADGTGGSSGGGGLLGGALVDRSGSQTPAGISPPFPFSSLVLAFLFVVPMNFVIQLYGGSIINERINRRGELLLVAPVGRSAIVAGKTLPYAVGLAIVSVVIALAVGGGALSVAAVVPVAALFLAASFVGAMFARSFKELTFVTVTISVCLSSYVFVPAIFTNVTPIALISPLTLVVWDLQGESVALAEYAFSTGPFYLTSALLFALGTGVYREEDMFSQRAVHLKAMDALANYVRGPRSVAVVTALSIPFVLVAELLAIAILFAIPRALSVPTLLLAVSVIEELAKSLHVYAGFAHNRWKPTARSALVIGAASGAGFFVAEKATHVVSVVGITTLDLGRVAFPEATDYDPLVAVGLFFLPLALHAATAAVSALGARRDRWHYVATLGIAVSLHTLYNYGVMTYVG